MDRDPMYTPISGGCGSSHARIKYRRDRGGAVAGARVKLDAGAARSLDGAYIAAFVLVVVLQIAATRWTEKKAVRSPSS